MQSPNVLNKAKISILLCEQTSEVRIQLAGLLAQARPINKKGGLSEKSLNYES